MPDLCQRIMVAISERDAAVTETVARWRGAAGGDPERVGLSLGEAVEWYGETITVRAATRLRRLATEP